ncbi:hypothetical protein [Candidatus Kinetoplastidibacterium blastocrithidiae]|nr:hypothetical protein [Candidatus Kinetoplastibacterium blastocrithidii]
MEMQSILSEMRLIKDDNEISKMRRSAKISANAHKKFCVTVK